ncbi:hypothetical protein C8J57DRAFT_1719238 [Mycena rebaudengoi]|nr:hypothetical protein C8J57DRAFT_1719238 [Mycena rebaudengoi]
MPIWGPAFVTGLCPLLSTPIYCACSAMTFAVLRALDTILGDALADIEAVYRENSTPVQQQGKGRNAYVSPPPSPGFPYTSSQSSPPEASSSSSLPPAASYLGEPLPDLPALDFPALDAPYDATSQAEQLTSHPRVVAAINRIVAAAGQMAATVQVPFLTLCDASMGYHLPACLRLLEAAHIPDILREGPPDGVHVREIAKRTGVDVHKLAHILRLLATHHLLRETAPDVFARNRIGSLVESGKRVDELFSHGSPPERKYDDTNGIAAFVGLCTDELFKSSAYLTEAYFPGGPAVSQTSASASGTATATRTTGASGGGVGSSLGSSSTSNAPSSSSNASNARTTTSALGPNGGNGAVPALGTPATHDPTHDPTCAPFNYAFGCRGVGYFGWLEGEGWADSAAGSAADGSARAGGTGAGAGGSSTSAGSSSTSAGAGVRRARTKSGGGASGKHGDGKVDGSASGSAPQENPNRFRLERFGKAMAGTGSWEAPGAVLQGFDWASLPRGALIVDVGGGIGSTSMLLASAHADAELRFVIQDRPVVVEMGEKAWRAKCPELLDSGAVQFQVHDFFKPQPITSAAVFLLRVVLHDWPDAYAQRILLRLREAAAPGTRLVLADFVLPLACVDDFGMREGKGAGGEGSGTVGGGADGNGIDGGGGNMREGGAGEGTLVEGAEKMLAPAPLLANLGKASANVYWMDLTMQVTFNGQERTLRETVALALSAGWKVVRVTKAPGSLFGHIVAVPVAVPVPSQRRARAGSGSAFFDVGPAAGSAQRDAGEVEMERVLERASSRCGTPTFGSRVDLPSVAEARARFGGSVVGRRPFGAGASGSSAASRPPPLKQAAVLTVPPARKKKPSPLSMVPPPSSPSPSLYQPQNRTLTSPRPQVPQQQQQGSPIMRRVSQTPLFHPQSQQSTTPSPVGRPPPPPSPMSPRLPLSRRSSYAHLSSHMVQLQSAPPQPPPPAQRALRHVPSSPVLKQHLHQQQQPSPPSPLPSRIPAPHHQLSRRASHAQLQPPQTELRKRSGSIIHPSMARASGSGSSIGLGNLLQHGRPNGGGSLDFGLRSRREDGDEYSASADEKIASGRASPAFVPVRSVLAAAARIERGVPRTPSPM